MNIFVSTCKVCVIGVVLRPGNIGGGRVECRTYDAVDGLVEYGRILQIGVREGLVCGVRVCSGRLVCMCSVVSVVGGVVLWATTTPTTSTAMACVSIHGSKIKYITHILHTTVNRSGSPAGGQLSTRRCGVACVYSTGVRMTVVGIDGVGVGGMEGVSACVVHTVALTNSVTVPSRAPARQRAHVAAIHTVIHSTHVAVNNTSINRYSKVLLRSAILSIHATTYTTRTTTINTLTTSTTTNSSPILGISHPQRHIPLHRRHLHADKITLQLFLNLPQYVVALGPLVMLQLRNEATQVGLELARLGYVVLLRAQGLLLSANVVLQRRDNGL